MMHSTELDLGPLTWVKGEIDQALGRASTCLDEARTSNEPGAQLQFAQTHLHQVYGALSIVGLDAIARVCKSLEILLGSLLRNEHNISTEAVYSLADRSIAAIGNYLEDIARGEPDRPLRLSRIYCEIEAARGEELPNPADLFNPELVSKPELSLYTSSDEARRQNAIKRVRAQFEKGLLLWLKSPANPEAATLMADACAQTCALQRTVSEAVFWWSCQAFLQALGQQALPANSLVRRICTQIGREMRRISGNTPGNLPDHLLREILYWAGQATPVTRLQREVRSAWQIDQLMPQMEEFISELPLAPLIKQLYQDIGALKSEWDRVTEGDQAALPAFQESLEAALPHAQQLGRPALNALMQNLIAVTQSLHGDPLKVTQIAGLEIASALLLIEMLLDKSIPDAEFHAQTANTIPRLKAIARGQALQTNAELPATSASRKLGERQARIQVAREILGNLAQVEQTLDDFFRDQSKKAPLADLSGPMQQIKGALNLMGDAQATNLVTEAIETISALSKTDSPDPALFEPLAHQLSALSMYVDALQHGATSVQRFLGGEPEPLQEPIKPAQDVPAQTQGTGPGTSRNIEAPQPAAFPAFTQEQTSVPPAPDKEPETADSAGIDDELLEIFIEEAHEVVGTIADELGKLRTDSSETSTLVTIRRGFHTLKGSGRMVGLLELSDAAKNIEQTLNLWLQLEKEPDARLISLIDEAETLFGEWVEQIASGGAHAHPCEALMAQAESLRLTDTEPATATAPASPQESPVSAAATTADTGTDELECLDFELDEPTGFSVDLDFEALPDTPLAADDASVAEAEIALAASLDRALEPTSDDQDAISVEDSFLATVVELNTSIFSEDEDPTLCITALDSSAFDFTREPEDAAADLFPEIPELALDSAPKAALLADDHGDELQIEDLDIDLSTFATADHTRDLHLEPGELDGTEEVLPFDFGDLSLELDNDTRPLDAVVSTPTETEPLPEALSEPLTETFTLVDDEALPEDDALLDLDLTPVSLLEDEDEAPFADQADTQPEPEALVSAEPPRQTAPTPPQAAAAPAPTAAPVPAPSDTITIGEAVISAGLFKLFIDEAQQYVTQLESECQRLSNNDTRFPDTTSFRAAHTLAGISATTRIQPMHTLARALEHALHRLNQHERAPSQTELRVIAESVSKLASMLSLVMLHTWPGEERDAESALDGVGLLPVVTVVSDSAEVLDLDLELDGDLLDGDLEHIELEDDETLESEALEALNAPSASPVPDLETPDIEELPALETSADEGFGQEVTDTGNADQQTPANLTEPVPEPDTVAAEAEPARHSAPVQLDTPALKDELDLQLLPIFVEEGRSLLSQLDSSVRQLRNDPTNQEHVTACARMLHTLKGSARMAGAMRIGEEIHQLESRLESSRNGAIDTGLLCDELEVGIDHAAQQITALASPGSRTARAPIEFDTRPTGTTADSPLEPQDTAGGSVAVLRVRADKVDAFVDQAGEIGIARTRIEGEMRTLRSSLLDLTENVIRLRNQLREVELQAETQMQSRIAQAESAHSEFDPLEMDRYTRLQELTRMMAESVADVTTVQQNLLRNLDGAEMALNSQARMARELQQSLMQVRMVPFDNIASRLYRIVRQTAKDMGKRANLDLRGGRMELDRGVLETMVAPLEHLLRNAVAHGLEEPAQRQALGKDPVGQLVLSVRQEGNEVAITLSDDGAGLNLERIARQALEQGLLSADEAKDPRKLANMIFVPGFSTAASLSAVSGRGIGMDVVKADTASVGGRVDVVSQPGQGTEFRINLPLTLATTQALLVRCAGIRHAIPSGLIAQVMDVKAALLERIVKDGGVMWQDTFYPYSYLPWLMGDNETQPEPQKQVWLLLLRSGDQTLALHVDSLHGNQEVVVKNAGPQLVRIIGISGVTLLADGEIVLIVNPVALSLRPRMAPSTPGATVADESPATASPVRTIPTVMVVDDSLTVRKILGRMLEREGYRVITGKDGVDALERLMDEVPDVILSDIEMPRMDGFELLRNIRADARTATVPVIMITSRLADKHREYAMSLGANHYLGKPYDEDELLGLLSTFTEQTRH